jgi:hypothetical protein
MQGYSAALRNEVDALLQEGYRLWEEAGLPPLGREERCAAAAAAGTAYCGSYAREFAAACQCFYLFRMLHRLPAAFPESATLLGDWFFSQFSRHLIPLDNVPLILAFSEVLARDAALDCDAGGGAGDPLAFIPAVLRAVRT